MNIHRKNKKEKLESRSETNSSHSIIFTTLFVRRDKGFQEHLLPGHLHHHLSSYFKEGKKMMTSQHYRKNNQENEKEELQGMKTTK